MKELVVATLTLPAPMEFSLSLRSYNMFGGHPVLRLVPDFLLDGAPDFGPAVTEIEVTALLAHPAPRASEVPHPGSDRS
jgi:hypothetical protein